MTEKEKSIYYILHILVLKEDTYQRKTVGVLKRKKYPIIILMNMTLKREDIYLIIVI